MLDEARWKRGASGVREKDGTPLRFELLGQAGSKPLENSIVSVQEQWAAIGVQAIPETGGLEHDQ